MSPLLRGRRALLVVIVGIVVSVATVSAPLAVATPITSRNGATVATSGGQQTGAAALAASAATVTPPAATPTPDAAAQIPITDLSTHLSRRPREVVRDEGQAQPKATPPPPDTVAALVRSLTTGTLRLALATHVVARGENSQDLLHQNLNLLRPLIKQTYQLLQARASELSSQDLRDIATAWGRFLAAEVSADAYLVSGRMVDLRMARTSYRTSSELFRAIFRRLSPQGTALDGELYDNDN